MLKYIEEIQKATSERKALERYNSKNWFMRLISRKPVITTVDPVSIAAEWTKNMKTFYREMDGNYIYIHCCYNNGGEGEYLYPVIIYRAFVNGCYYESRKAFDNTGATHEWGISYPYSECGCTGLYCALNKHLNNIPLEYYHAEEMFYNLIESLRKEILS